MNTPFDKLQLSKNIFDLAINLHRPDYVVALVSGGDDSMAMYNVARKIGYIDWVVHVDTTTGIKDVTSFVEDNITEDLMVVKTNEATYEEIVLENGFPGPGQHSTMYIRLKERALRVAQRILQHKDSFCRVDGSTAHKKKTPLLFHSDYPESEALVVKKPQRKIMYLTGARRDESVRRMGNVVDIQKEGNQIWVNLISDWTKQNCYDFRISENYKQSPTAAILGRSGECNCGAYGSPQELIEMKYFFPTDPNIKMIERVQKELRGKKHKYCNYGHGGVNKELTTSQENKIISKLCSTCENNFSNRY